MQDSCVARTAGRKFLKRPASLFCLLAAGLLWAAPISVWAQETPGVPLLFNRFALTASPLHLNEQSAGEPGVPPKRFWRGAGELMIVQLIPWSFNKYVRKADFADLTLDSWKENLKLSSWTWDDNNFPTNQFAHPYHGNLYFNCFRTNGYNFWESAPFSFVGSYMWETFGETHPPAINDFISTSLGGISLGEATYRLSALVLDNTATGAGRIWREIGATAINPVRGFNRLIDGEWTRVSATPSEWRPKALRAQLHAGYRRIGTEFESSDESVEAFFDKGQSEFFVDLGLLYGDPFVDIHKPFSSFQFNAELASTDSAKLNRVQGRGTLQGWELKNTASVQHVAGVYMHYDYFNNPAFEYGGQSFSLSLLSRYQLGKSTRHVTTDIGLNAVALGAVPQDYVVVGEGRDYDFGCGAGLRLNAGFGNSDWTFFAIGVTSLWLNTVNGLNSNHFVQGAFARLQVPVARTLALGVSASYFYRHSDYVDYAEVDRRNPIARAFLSWEIGY